MVGDNRGGGPETESGMESETESDGSALLLVEESIESLLVLVGKKVEFDIVTTAANGPESS